MSASSADTQLLCTEAFGTEDDSSSALVSAGNLSGIPGPQDMIIELTSLYGFSAYAVQLGISYFARLCRLDRSLLASALHHPILAPLVGSDVRHAILTGHRMARVGTAIKARCPAHQWVMAVLLVCIFVAAKNVEALRYRRLLPSMLSHALNFDVQPSQATIVEMECLQALEWRLGPHFHTAQELRQQTA
ncbi:hypothetical protein WJX84_004980 [Apatococcus fuscideae]|uniref:Cyclin N-terminal domain-containing protein n=1 Tax=Apatococcus fuscideae TaxID=2026836 RepID=A0AAW1T954_9CHLO